MRWGIYIAGICAGSVNGLIGAGGGMVLVPLLGLITDLKEDEVFPVSVCLILPICIVSLLMSPTASLSGAWGYLVGSAAGGILAGLFGRKIPTLWLHRVLGLVILWGGIRCLF